MNQGGASGSTGIQLGGKQMRVAAAEARRVLVEMAAAKLGAPADKLDRRTTASSAPAPTAPRSVTYAELIGGRYFNVQLDWNKKYGNPLYAPGKAQPKKPSEHKIVGQPIKREDVAPKVFAQENFVTDVKVPGMVHGRMIRPAVAGSVPVKVDDSALKTIPGAKVVWDKGFLGVVADKEWDAIQAAEKLKVEWSTVQPPFPDQAKLYDHIRKAPVRKAAVEKQNGNVEEAFKSAAKIIEADYEWPFQSHASMGPACALVEIKDGNVTCWSGTQKSHFVQQGLALTLGVPVDKVRVIWAMGPGSYGRNDADDAAMDAAVLAKAVGKPVRLQYMRDQGTGWDPKGPASTHKARAALDASGKVTAYEFSSKGFSRVDVNTNGGHPWDTLAGQTQGVALKSGDGFGVPAESYAFDNKKLSWETIAPLLDRSSPLRTSHLRDPVGPQIHFASESFIDEVAAAVGADADRIPPASHQGAARHRRHQGGGGKGEMGHAALAAQGPDRQQGVGPRHRLCAAQRHAGGGDRRSRRRPLDRQDLGAQVHRRARLRADHQPGRADEMHRGQYRAGRQPHAVGGSDLRPQERDQRRLDQLSDPRHHRDAGRGRTLC